MRKNKLLGLRAPYLPQRGRGTAVRGMRSPICLQIGDTEGVEKGIDYNNFIRLKP